MEYLFRKDSAVFMISGRVGFGKTDFALRMGEDALDEGLIKRMGTNIRTEDERVDHITNMPDLKDWMRTVKGSKYFFLDEAGKILKRMRFMSKLNLLILDIVQLSRHYDAKFCAAAPSERFIDSNYLNTDILSCKLKKKSLEICEVKNFLTWEAYTLNDVERTGIRFWSKDIASFSLERPVDLSKFSIHERCAYEYGQGKPMSVIGQGFEDRMHRQTVARNVQKYLRIHFKELASRHTSPT